MATTIEELVQALSTGVKPKDDKSKAFNFEIINQPMILRYKMNVDADNEENLMLVELEGNTRHFLVEDNTLMISRPLDLYPQYCDTPMWTIDRITDIIFHEGFKPYLRGDQELNAPFKLIAGNIREVLDILALTLKEKAPHVKLTILDVDQPNRIPMRHTVERRPFYEN